MDSFVPFLSVLAALASALTGILAWFTVSRRQSKSSELPSNVTTTKGLAQSIYLGSVDKVDVFFQGDGNIMTFGSTGSGKTQLIAKAISRYSGYVVAFDPTGELGNAIEQFGKKNLIRFGLGGAYLNPFDLLNPEGPRFERDCSQLADLIVSKGTSEAIEYYVESARSLLADAIKEVASNEPKDARTLHGVRMYVERGMKSLNPTNTEKDIIFKRLTHQMGNEAASSVLVAVLSSLRSFGRTFGVSSEGALEKFEAAGTTDVMLFSEPDGGYRPNYSTVMFGFCLSKFSSRDALDQTPKLVVLDEAGTFSAHDILEDWIVLGKSNQTRIWTAYQSVAQVRSLNRRGSETMISNAEMFQFLSSSDRETLGLLRSFDSTKQVEAIVMQRRANVIATSGKVIVLDEIDFTRTKFVN